MTVLFFVFETFWEVNIKKKNLDGSWILHLTGEMTFNTTIKQSLLLFTFLLKSVLSKKCHFEAALC